MTAPAADTWRFGEQPAGLAWPTQAWELAAPGDVSGDEVAVDELARLADRTFDTTTEAELGRTSALLAVHRGRVVLERHGDGSGPSTTFPSWSMAKSVLHAAVGVLVDTGRLDVDEAVAWPGWWEGPAGAEAGDVRRRITVDHLLAMRSGLAWAEDYVDAQRSDVQEMLWGSGKADMAAYAAGRAPAHPPGDTYAYSSGTSNLLSWVVAQRVGAGDAYRAFLQRSLLDPLGMTSAVPKFDAAGTWIASSCCFATARDVARFAYLYLRGGRWEDRQLLPRRWVVAAATPQPGVDDEGWGYGRHWWTLPGRPGLFFANGFQGQYALVVPDRDLVLVRLGVTDASCSPALVRHLLAVVDCFATIAEG